MNLTRLSIIVGSTVIAGATLSPAGAQAISASDAPESAIRTAHTSHIAHIESPYRKGYKHGKRDGAARARDYCSYPDKTPLPHIYVFGEQNPRTAYDKGYQAGYKAGYRQSYKKNCPG